jgi:hypothetical protein
MRLAVFAGICGLLLAEGGMAIARARQDSGFFSQPRSSRYLISLLLVLAAYLTLTLWLGAKSPSRLLPFPLMALTAGAAAGMLEIAGVFAENLFPNLKIVPIAFELSIFLSWAVVAALASRRGHSVVAGILTAMAAASLCMVIGVCGGELAEFFLHPAPASEVSTWAEFQRSHWSNPASFQVANTMDSATTHLTMAPLVALILGSAGAAAGLLGRKMAIKR